MGEAYEQQWTDDDLDELSKLWKKDLAQFDQFTIPHAQKTL